MILINGMRLGRGLNDREHHMQRSRRVKAERSQVAWVLAARNVDRPEPPLLVTLTRIAPSAGLDKGDNLNGSLKAVRDQVAAWLGVDDKLDHVVEYAYAQERGPWGVKIEWCPLEPKEPQA